MDYRVSPYLNREPRSLDEVVEDRRRIQAEPVLSQPAADMAGFGNADPVPAATNGYAAPGDPIDLPHFSAVQDPGTPAGRRTRADTPSPVAPTVLFVEAALRERPERAYEIVVAALRVSPSIARDIVAAALGVAPSCRQSVLDAARDAARATRVVA